MLHKGNAIEEPESKKKGENRYCGLPEKIALLAL